MSKHRRTRTARLRAEATAIKRRLEHAVRPNMSGPVLGRANIACELSARTKATGHSGIGLVAKLISAVGLAGEIDSSLELLKLHKPYHESDHVLNIAYNALCGGQRLQDIEARRCDRVFHGSSGFRRCFITTGCRSVLACSRARTARGSSSCRCRLRDGSRSRSRSG